MSDIEPPPPRVHHLIARHAEGTLWLARYIERVENLARLLDVTNTFARDADDTRNWLSILRINGDQVEFYKRHQEANQATVADFYVLDGDNPTSVQTAMAAARLGYRCHIYTDERDSPASQVAAATTVA